MSANTTRVTRRPAAWALHACAAALAGVVLLTVSTFGGSYASWSAAAPAAAGIITSGSLTLKVNSQTSVALPAAGFQGMLPGDRRTQNVTLSTTGNVASTLTVTGTVGGNGHQVRVASGACTTTAISGSALGATPVNLGTLAPTDTTTVCVEVMLPASAPAAAQGRTTDFTLTFVATQKAG
ncbi:hypothetical protein FB562_0707 [Homoserinimonas aerilata]|uniref:Ribosomally synthesized peptide with SipW-like signal peptide n=1 Tax=Homoserinimonas aerilata TaxID=1162970 RepID=A0A542YHY9_9MICO|nr:hypothetical protein [Homoserinimonas aerilata]TQL47641.1 hypothetical protein FB562_0707 [Homoserinimonas aerilata]